MSKNCRDNLINATEFLSKPQIEDLNQVDSEGVKRLFKTANSAGRKSVLHLSASRLKTDPETNRYFVGGGGLAEMLNDQIPLENYLGIESQLLLPISNKPFYEVCMKIFNMIIAEEKVMLNEDEKAIYNNASKEFVSKILSTISKFNSNIVVIHDFEYLPIVCLLPKNIKTILQWHVDFPAADTDISKFLSFYISKYDEVVVADKDVERKIKKTNPSVHLIYPSINPVSQKNSAISKVQAEKILSKLNIDVGRPTISQIGRLSSQKNPIAAIEVYEEVKKEIPEAQLILVGIFNIPGKDHLETMELLEDKMRSVGGVHLFSDIEQIRPFSNSQLIGAVYTTSDLVLNMGKKEAFGLVMTEAMWKHKPIVAIESPGSKMQINDKNGFLVNSIQSAAKTSIDILNGTIDTKKIKLNAHESVKNNYLISHYLQKMLLVYNKCLQ